MAKRITRRQLRRLICEALLSEQARYDRGDISRKHREEEELYRRTVRNPSSNRFGVALPEPGGDGDYDPWDPSRPEYKDWERDELVDPVEDQVEDDLEDRQLKLPFG